MISPYQERNFRPLQPMEPLFQRQLDGQQFSIANVIFVLRWGEAMGEYAMNWRLGSGCVRMGAEVSYFLRPCKALSATGDQTI